MKVVIDVEANSLHNPTKIWCIVCKDVDTGKIYIFRKVTDDSREAKRFINYCNGVHLFIGHNVLGYDRPVLDSLLPYPSIFEHSEIIDTLVVSKLVNYSRPGHSIEQYGEEFGLEKLDVGKSVAGHNPFFDQWSQKMEDYCVRDVDICLSIYRKFAGIINDPAWHAAIDLEQKFQLVVNGLHTSGFSFNTKRADALLSKVTEEVAVLDKEILTAFPPKTKFVKEYCPRATKHGTISRTSVPRGFTDLSTFAIGSSFCTFTWSEFNPSSHKQIIEVLNEAEWKPFDKTKTHIDTLRELQRARYLKKDTRPVDITSLSAKMVLLEKYGWKINEENLSTLPPTAPTPARLLAKRILLESRRRTLTEWLGLVRPDNRIHGEFYGIGAWTHRMAHQKPNTANIPNEFNVHDGSRKLLGKELRSLWQAPRKRLLVGVDADSIQLRVFAHYINDPGLTKAIVDGKKSNKTDPHSFNQRIFGPCCKTRQASKHSLYAIFFGGGPGKIAEIMGCSRQEAEEAIDRLRQRYSGLNKLEREVFPVDAQRGYFIGLDGRRVPIPGDTVGNRKHLCMSGYLQNGEAIIMKMATLKWHNKLKEFDSHLVNFVHDEWQTEAPNDMSTAIRVARIQADSLATVGEELKLNCPLAGSYYDDVHDDYTIGTNWSVTH